MELPLGHKKGLLHALLDSFPGAADWPLLKTERWTDWTFAVIWQSFMVLCNLDRMQIELPVPINLLSVWRPWSNLKCIDWLILNDCKEQSDWWEGNRRAWRQSPAPWRKGRIKMDYLDRRKGKYNLHHLFPDWWGVQGSSFEVSFLQEGKKWMS